MKGAVAGVLGGMLVISGCSSTSTSNATDETLRSAARQHYEREGEVYLLRGLANVFSQGMDVIGERLQRRGVNARVYNHSAWRTLADDVLARSKRFRGVSYPIIIMGHSLGGNATMQMAKYLGDNGIKVSYAVSFDPTITTFVGPNVGEVINYYLPNSDHTNVVKESSGFKGSLRNVDVTVMPGVTHLNVEKNDQLQTGVIRTTMKLARQREPEEGRGDAP